MDLLSSIRKEGSRGGVDFKWDDVKTSQHRENYMGHSLMAPVGRWQKGKDLSWYAKGDSDVKVLNRDGKEETAEEKKLRERKDEIRRVKEAEEDALARALGLPVTDRGSGLGTGVNNIDVGEMKRVIKETEAGDDEIEEVGRGRGFGDFVGKVGMDGLDPGANQEIMPNQGGLMGATYAEKGVKRPQRREERSRSRDRKHRHHRHRDRSRDQRENLERRRHRDGDRHRERTNRSPRPQSWSREGSRNPQPRPRERERERERRRHRSRSPDVDRRAMDRRQFTVPYNENRPRSRTPPLRDNRRQRSRSDERRRDGRGERAVRDGRQRWRSRSPLPAAGERWRDGDGRQDGGSGRREGEGWDRRR